MISTITECDDGRRYLALVKFLEVLQLLKAIWMTIDSCLLKERGRFRWLLESICLLLSGLKVMKFNLTCSAWNESLRSISIPFLHQMTKIFDRKRESLTQRKWIRVIYVFSTWVELDDMRMTLEELSWQLASRISRLAMKSPFKSTSFIRLNIEILSGKIEKGG